MMRYQSLRYPGLERDTLNAYCDGVLDGQQIPRRDGKPAQIDEAAAS